MRPLIPLPRRRRPRPRLVAIQVLPTIVTLGNLLAGVLALAYIVDARGASGEGRDLLWVQAAVMILAGMLCDALDGRVARLTGAASAFGAELDSLADVVTFGVVPALLAKEIAQASIPSLSARLATTLALVYALGAALRLARYNVESNRVTESGHETRVFRGLPSPGAAGVIAALTLLLEDPVFGTAWTPWAILVAAPACGVLMVSRLGYAHVMNRWLSGARSPVAILLLLIAGILMVQHPGVFLVLLFGGYAVSGPLVWVAKLAFGRPRWAVDEDEDEVQVPEVDASPPPVDPPSAEPPADDEDRSGPPTGVVAR